MASGRRGCFGGKLKRFTTGALAGAALCWLLICAAAWGNHNTTDLVSVGPAGGNGAFSSQWRGASADGTRVIFQSSEPLVAADTDTRMDLYERTAGATTLLSLGSNGGNEKKKSVSRWRRSNRPSTSRR